MTRQVSRPRPAKWYALGDLAAVSWAAVVVEDRYSALFKQRHAFGRRRRRPRRVPDSVPTIPLVFCATRPLAEKWTYRGFKKRRACAFRSK